MSPAVAIMSWASLVLSWALASDTLGPGVLLVILLPVFALLQASPSALRLAAAIGPVLAPLGLRVLSGGDELAFVLLGTLVAAPAVLTLLARRPGTRPWLAAVPFVGLGGFLVVATGTASPLRTLTVLGLIAIAGAMSARPGSFRLWPSPQLAGFTVATVILLLVAVVRTAAPAPALQAAASRLPGDLLALGAALAGLEGRPQGLVSILLAAAGGALVFGMAGALVWAAAGPARLLTAMVGMGLVAHVLVTRVGVGYGTRSVYASAALLLPVLVAALATVAGAPRTLHLRGGAVLRAVLPVMVVLVGASTALALGLHVWSGPLATRSTTGLPVAVMIGWAVLWVAATAAATILALAAVAILDPDEGADVSPAKDVLGGDVQHARAAGVRARGGARVERGYDVGRTATLVAFIGMLLVLQFDLGQHAAVSLLRDSGASSLLTVVDRSPEIVLWAILVMWIAVTVVRAEGLATLPRTEGRVAALSLLAMTAGMLALQVGATVRVEGLTAGAMRPAAVVGAIAVVALIGLRPMSSGVMTAIGLVVLVGVALLAVGADVAFLDEPRSRTPRVAFAQGRLRGLSGHPNLLGAAAVFLLAAALVRPWERRSRRAALLAVIVPVAVFVLLATDSQTAGYAVVLGVVARFGTQLLLPARLGAAWMLLLSTIAAAAVTAVPFVAVQRLPEFALTGRVHLWAKVLTIPPDELRFGLGPSPLSYVEGLRERIGLVWGAIDSHNLALEMLLVAGLPGLAFAFLFVLTLFWAALATRAVTGGWSMFVATVGAALSTMESFFLGGSVHRDLALVLVGLLLGAGLGRDPQSPSRTRAAAAAG